MATYIKHYRNSFLDIQNEKIRILMDPWINTANEGSWAASAKGKEFLFNSLIKKKIDYIYISHLHTDHFDLQFLKQLKRKQKETFKIIIKKFKDKRLKNKLILSGFSKNQIIDINEYEIFNLSKESKIIILPQISSSNTPSHYIKYDLDTSCVFIDSDVKLYNQVDNPYSVKDIDLVMKKLSKKIKINFDVAFIPYCAASEFPQSFINLNRIKEKNSIIKKRINKFLNISRSIDSKIVIPAGGSYHLDNIFSKLNKFLAIPSFKVINYFFRQKKIKKFNLIDTKKYYFIVNKNKISFKNHKYEKYFQSKPNNNPSNIGYNKIKTNFSSSNIRKTISQLENKMLEFKKILYDKTNTKIKFCIWDKQPVLIDKIKIRNPRLEHEVKFSNKPKSTELKIHVYYKLFLGIIDKKVSWNEVQNHCLFERKPNKYDPDIVFWLNLYKF